MNTYHSDIMNAYKNAEKRVEIYNQIIKDHKKLLKNYEKGSKEYEEIKELIAFVKGLDDYKKMNREVLFCMLGMANFK